MQTKRQVQQLLASAGTGPNRRFGQNFLVDLNPARLGVFFPALAFGWLRARRGTIVAPVLAHGMSNVFMELFRAGLGLGV